MRPLALRSVIVLATIAWLAAATALAAEPTPAPTTAPPAAENFRRENLVAWCIVPFDAKRRSPAERAEMLARLGLKRVAYDWRENHVAEFETEIEQYARHGIEYFAFWGTHERAFELFAQHKLRPQIWQMLPVPPAGPDRIQAAAKAILPLVERTRQLGCRLALYNHGGWGGEPATMAAVCRQLRAEHQADHVGIVYNLHHGHDHLDDFADALRTMQPYLFCLNLNGMATDGDRRGQKILPLGAGEHDLRLLRAIVDSGYRGPIGIIGHTNDDVELRLRDNLDGLEWLLPQLAGQAAGPQPRYRTYQPNQSAAATPPAAPGVLLDGQPEYRLPPLTLECRATLSSSQNYNILAASDSKASGQHWELFTMKGTGRLTAYLPGCRPDHVHSETAVCDGRPHHLAMLLGPQRVRLFVDGRQVADQQVERLERLSLPGGFAIGRLVEGGLGCDGRIAWVRLSRGTRQLAGNAPETVARDDATLLLWQAPATTGSSPAPSDASHETPPYSPELVARLIAQAKAEGNAERGAQLFAAAKGACLQCHRVGRHGGQVGPDLSKLASERKPEEIVESLLWPQRQVKPEFVTHRVETADGRLVQGYLVRKTDQMLVLRDPTRPAAAEVVVPLAAIERQETLGTLMPENLTAALTSAERADLLRFLLDLGGEQSLAAARWEAILSRAHPHGAAPATFAFTRDPLHPEQWPSWQKPINRQRLYDFYTKQAEHFRQQAVVPPLLGEFPGLDGGPGHWGNQNDTTWVDDRWNRTDLGRLQCGVFRGGDVVVPRGVCVRLGERGELACCFNPDTLTYDAVWSGGFLKFSNVRHGFLGGLLLDGTLHPRPQGTKPAEPFVYHGFYRAGERVLFAYRLGDREWLDSPWVDANGQFERQVAPRDEHPLRHLLRPAPSAATESDTLKTEIAFGQAKPYAIDTIRLPTENPWRALLFCTAHAFLPQGDAVVATMQGDLWRVSGFAYPSHEARWRRIATGLHQPLGVYCDGDGLFVLGRDQLTRLHDTNGDGVIDFHECYSHAYLTSVGGHDYICGLERDAQGRFYTASSNQGLLRIARDGRNVEVLASGFRNPDGVGLFPDNVATIPCSEGDWTPASMICAIPPPPEGQPVVPRNFRYPAAGQGPAPALPMVFLPRGMDNSSGGQTFISSAKWGPLQGLMLHFSFGAGSHFLVLRDEVRGRMQGTIVPLPGEFLSGSHRGRFHPQDGQLYVTGMQGWGSYTPEDGCFHRVRYTGDPVQLPVAARAHENGVAITFSGPLDPAVAADVRQHFAQCWNYRYSGAYGSPEFSTRHYGVKGHDVLPIAGATVLAGGQTLFLELPDLQPVNQLHLRVASSSSQRHDLVLTVHDLHEPFTALPHDRPAKKTIAPHPIHADMALLQRSVPNPFRQKLAGARKIALATADNLSFAVRSFRVKAGEPIELNFTNSDVVPHNWALIQSGSLERVGRQVDRLIADPDAIYRQYIPLGNEVLAYTDVTLPGDGFRIYFQAPKEPGRYPYLCTFPGHWKVMNGEMIVED